MGEPVVVEGTPVDPADVTAARAEASPDVRFLLGGLVALLIGVARPTAAVPLGVPFATVFPVGVGLFLLASVSLVLWFRSSTATLVVETRRGTHRERPEVLDRGERLVERLSR